MKTKLPAAFTALTLLFAAACSGPTITGDYDLPSSPPETLSITSLPDLTEFTQGFPLNLSGLEVTLIQGSSQSVINNYSLSWEKDDGSECKISDGDIGITADPGVKKITVHYSWEDASADLTVGFEIKVVEKRWYTVFNSGDWDSVRQDIAKRGGGSYTVIIATDIPVEVGPSADFSNPSVFVPTFGNTPDIDITLQAPKGKNATLALDPAKKGPLIYMGDRQKLVIDSDGLTLQGSLSNDSPLLVIEGGAAVLDLRGGNIANNTNNTGNGGGILVNGGHFLMSGGAVSGNTAVFGGGVYLKNSSSFEMSGGTVNGNTTTCIEDDKRGYASGGGGVNVDNSTFTMTGKSSIYQNKSVRGGGVIAINGGTIIMADKSSITGNVSESGGGGIRLGNQKSMSTLIMKGGSISGNRAGCEGGGVSMFADSCVQMENGIIYGDDAWDDLKNIDNGTSAALRMPYGDVAEYGTFEANGGFVSNGPLGKAVNDTIKVVDGVLQ